MPSTSKRQARFMAAASHDAAFAKRAGISQTVAREFHAADKAKASPGVRRVAEAMKRRKHG
jgi:hypothetical protein